MTALTRARARQWSRTAFALALLFGSLPLASRVLLGSWAFGGAAQLAGLCLMAGAYFHLAARRLATLPDEAASLHRAIQLAASGRASDAMGLLDRTIRLSPRFWQAYQCRAEIHLSQQSPELARDDLTAAIRLAPNEFHLYRLRAYAFHLLGDPESAAADLETAQALESR